MSPNPPLRGGVPLLLALVFVLLSVGLSSCMHAGMMGTGDSDHASAAHTMTPDPMLEKEVIVGDVRASGLFPPLKLGEDVTLTLTLKDARAATPISGAQVYLHAQYAHRLAPHSDHREDSSQTNEREHDINFDQDVAESSTPGVYTIPYRPYQPGEHILTFHITAIGDRALEPEITVEATRFLSDGGHDHQSGMMEGSTATTYVIIGAVVMGAMMAIMLIVGGNMF